MICLTRSKSNPIFRKFISFPIVLVFIILILFRFPSKGNNNYRSYSKPIPTFKSRNQLGFILEAEGFKTGIELGVQRGLYSNTILSHWKSAELYVLVDLWAKQENYNDLSNADNKTHSGLMNEALKVLEKYKDRGTVIEVCKDFTTKCAERYSKSLFDFVYVDARHDYMGVQQDLEYWWPLVRPGGIFAGHDYVTNNDGPQQTRQNWSINFDGTVDPLGRAVKGAVDEFMNEKNIQISVSYRERAFNTWAVRKPL